MSQTREYQDPLREVEEGIRNLRSDANELRGAVKSLTFRYRRSRITLIAVVIGMIMTTIAGASLFYVSVRTNESVHCMRDWANTSTERTSNVLVLANARNNAADKLTAALNAALRAAIAQDQTNLPRLVKQWETAATAYDKATAAYKEGVKKNPVPLLPAFACKFL